MAYRIADRAAVSRPRIVEHPSAPSIVPRLPVERGRHSRPRFRVSLPQCPELDCVRHRLPAGLIALAELQAAEVGVGADRVLIAQGHIDEESYLAELAKRLGIAFEPLDGRPRDACPLSDDRLIEATNTGVLPLIIDGETTLVIAPRELTVRRLIAALRPGSDMRKRIRLTSGKRMSRFAARHAREYIGYCSAEALRAQHPSLSAGTERRRSISTALAVAALAVFAIMAPGITAIAVEVALGLIFLAWTALRLLGTLSIRSVRRVPIPTSDRQLPTYTIVIALYREAAAAKDLIAALRRLNYPALGSKGSSG